MTEGGCEALPPTAASVKGNQQDAGVEMEHNGVDHNGVDVDAAQAQYHFDANVKAFGPPPADHPYSQGGPSVSTPSTTRPQTSAPCAGRFRKADLAFAQEHGGHFYFTIGDDVFAKDFSGYFYLLDKESKQFGYFAESWQEDEGRWVGVSAPAPPTYLSFDKNGVPVFPRNDDGFPILPCNELGERIFPTDPESQMPIFPYDFTTKEPTLPLDENNGYPIFPSGAQQKPMVPLDSNGKAVFPRGEDGQYIFPMTETGQPVPPITVYGNPVVPIDESGQPVIPHDEAGTPLLYMGGDDQMTPMLYEEYCDWYNEYIQRTQAASAYYDYNSAQQSAAEFAQSDPYAVQSHDYYMDPADEQRIRYQAERAAWELANGDTPKQATTNNKPPVKTTTESVPIPAPVTIPTSAPPVVERTKPSTKSKKLLEMQLKDLKKKAQAEPAQVSPTPSAASTASTPQPIAAVAADKAIENTTPITPTVSTPLPQPPAPSPFEDADESETAAKETVEAPAVTPGTLKTITNNATSVERSRAELKKSSPEAKKRRYIPSPSRPKFIDTRKRSRGSFSKGRHYDSQSRSPSPRRSRRRSSRSLSRSRSRDSRDTYPGSRRSQSRSHSRENSRERREDRSSSRSRSRSRSEESIDKKSKKKEEKKKRKEKKHKKGKKRHRSSSPDKASQQSLSNENDNVEDGKLNDSVVAGPELPPASQSEKSPSPPPKKVVKREPSPSPSPTKKVDINPINLKSSPATPTKRADEAVATVADKTEQTPLVRLSLYDSEEEEEELPSTSKKQKSTKPKKTKGKQAPTISAKNSVPDAKKPSKEVITPPSSAEKEVLKKATVSQKAKDATPTPAKETVAKSTTSKSTTDAATASKSAADKESSTSSSFVPLPELESSPAVRPPSLPAVVVEAADDEDMDVETPPTSPVRPRAASTASGARSQPSTSSDQQPPRSQALRDRINDERRAVRNGLNFEIDTEVLDELILQAQNESRVEKELDSTVKDKKIGTSYSSENLAKQDVASTSRDDFRTSNRPTVSESDFPVVSRSAPVASTSSMNVTSSTSTTVIIPKMKLTAEQKAKAEELLMNHRRNESLLAAKQAAAASALAHDSITKVLPETSSSSSSPSLLVVPTVSLPPVSSTSTSSSSWAPRPRSRTPPATSSTTTIVKSKSTHQIQSSSESFTTVSEGRVTTEAPIATAPRAIDETETVASSEKAQRLREKAAKLLASTELSTSAATRPRVVRRAKRPSIFDNDIEYLRSVALNQQILADMRKETLRQAEQKLLIDTTAAQVLAWRNDISNLVAEARELFTNYMPEP